jgi:LCP family protein required for cell wall assembly
MSTPTPPVVPPSIPALGPSRRGRRKSPKYLWRRIAFVAVLCGLTGLVGGTLGSAARGLFAPAHLGTGDRTTILVAALDPQALPTNPADKAPRHTADALHLITLDHKAHAAAVVSIPRNTQALLGSSGKGALGDALAIGGIDLLKSTVADVTGMPIDYTIQIGPEAAKALVGELGETKLYLPKALQWEDKDQQVSLEVPSGDQTLSAEQTLAYAGYRAPNAELDRVHRQQFLMHAWQQKLRGLWGWWKAPGLAREGAAQLQTDLKADELQALAAELRGIAPEAVSYAVLPGHAIGNGWVISDQGLEALQQKLDAPASVLPLAEAKPTLEIVYDDGADDKVMNLAGELTKLGFQVIRTGRGPVPQSESRLIDRAKPGERSEALVQALDKAAHGLRVELATDDVATYGAQYTLELGKDFFR